MITVGNYPDLASAQIAQSLLDAAGIEATIPDEFLAGVNWQMSVALHGVRLQVTPDDADAARAVLAEGLRGDAAEEQPGDTDGVDVCAACGSGWIVGPRWKQRLKAVSLVFPFALLAWPFLSSVKPRFQCGSCGHVWR